MRVRVNEEDRSFIVRWKAPDMKTALGGVYAAEDALPPGYRIEKVSITVPNHGGRAKNVLFVLWHVDGSKPFLNQAEAVDWAAFLEAERGGRAPLSTPPATTPTPTAESASAEPTPSA